MGRVGTGALRALRIAGAALLWTVVLLCLAITILPRFLDRIYYRGPASGHYDGRRFFNPEGDGAEVPRVNLASLLVRQLVRDPDRPVWPDHVAVTPSKPPARVWGEAMLATWVGHATLLVQADGLNILTDPVWSETVGPFGIGPRRVAEPGVRFEDLPKIDLVVVSHDHYDHMDLATLRRLWDRDRPVIVTSLGNDSVIGEAGVPSRALDWGHRLTFGVRCRGDAPCPAPIDVSVTRNHHWGSRWGSDRNRALWSSFVVHLPHGNLFFAGDTGWGDGAWVREAARLGPFRLAMIPIGAFRFVPGQMRSDSHIGPWEAVRVWDGLGQPFAIPIHWGTFRLSREAYLTPPRLLAAMLDCAGEAGAPFAGVAIGQPVWLPPLRAARLGADMDGIARCQKQGRFDTMR